MNKCFLRQSLIARHSHKQAQLVVSNIYGDQETLQHLFETYSLKINSIYESDKLGTESVPSPQRLEAFSILLSLRYKEGKASQDRTCYVEYRHTQIQLCQ